VKPTAAAATKVKAVFIAERVLQIKMDIALSRWSSGKPCSRVPHGVSREKRIVENLFLELLLEG